MSRTLLVQAAKNFKITIPDGAKITFGPWSPQTENSKYGGTDKALNGTLRIYETAAEKSSVLAVFSGVSGYRDLSLDYAEEVAKEEGATIWKTDKDGYQREDKVKRSSEWHNPVPIGPGEPDNDPPLPF